MWMKKNAKFLVTYLTNNSYIHKEFKFILGGSLKIRLSSKDNLHLEIERTLSFNHVVFGKIPFGSFFPICLSLQSQVTSCDESTFIQGWSEGTLGPWKQNIDLDFSTWIFNNLIWNYEDFELHIGWISFHLAPNSKRYVSFR